MLPATLTIGNDGGVERNNDASMDRLTSIIKWALRVHLALFYLNGKYPTLSHRLAGIQITNGHGASMDFEGGGRSSGDHLVTIVANRPSYKVVGMLIALQSAGILAKGAARLGIEAIHSFRLARARTRRRRESSRERYPVEGIRRNDPTTSSQTGPFSGAQRQTDASRTSCDENLSDEQLERELYAASVERRVPSALSAAPVPPARGAAEIQRLSHTDSHPGHSIQCGVCMNERTNPAAPVACGHVFCWSCLLHWVSTVRAECPLCRLATRPQDILPLYHYSP